MNKRKNEVIEIPAKPVETDQPVKRQLRCCILPRIYQSGVSAKQLSSAESVLYR